MATINIGLDIGNYDTKTASTTTASGFSQYSKKPFSADEYLFYDGYYYIPKSERFPYLKDKTENENAFILSLFGIAKELLHKANEKNERRMRRAEKYPEEKEKVIGVQGELSKYTTINLGVGVPPIHHSVLSGKTVRYYQDHLKSEIEFIYNDYQYRFKLNKCVCFPQDLAAVMGYLPNNPASVIHYKSYYAIDIGGQTVDAITFIDGNIDTEKCDSKPLGILTMYEGIIKDIEMETGKRITKDIIESVLRGQPTILQDDMKSLILTYAQRWLKNIIGELEQFGMDFETYPVIFIGGGSLLFKPFIDDLNLVKYEYIDNPHANAEGYEKLLTTLLNMKKK